MDLEDRWEDAYNHSSSLVLDSLATSSTLDGNPIQSLRAWKEEGTKSAIDLTRSTRNSFFSPSRPASLDTREYLGKTVGMYVFVRETIGVECRRGDVFLGKQEQTVGTGVAKIYEAVKSGRMNEVLLDMFA
jgi:phenylalanine ammonia-lyase